MHAGRGQASAPTQPGKAGLKRLGIEKGKQFFPTDTQTQMLEEAAIVGEAWAMGNGFLKRDPVRHWAEDPGSQWQYILFMESPLDQIAETHMEIDTLSAYLRFYSPTEAFFGRSW